MRNERWAGEKSSQRNFNDGKTISRQIDLAMLADYCLKIRGDSPGPCLSGRRRSATFNRVNLVTVSYVTHIECHACKTRNAPISLNVVVNWVGYLYRVSANTGRRWFYCLRFVFYWVAWLLQKWCGNLVKIHLPNLRAGIGLEKH